MKRIVFKKILSGLLYGSALFTLTFLLIDYVFDISITVLPHQYTRIIIGAIFIGVGFVLSSLIYEEDRIPFIARTMIQLVFCVITLAIAFIISGGMPDGTGFGTGAFFFLIELGVGLVFWIGNFVYFFFEARKINNKLLADESISPANDQ